jgi:tetratricopeptide (TPR) repeat protein
MMATMDAKAARDTVTEYFSQGKFPEGIRLLEEHEKNLPAHVRLECWGNLNFYRRELQEAIHAYESAIALEPDYVIARYQYLVGVQLERAKDFTGAFKRYQAAIGAEPTFVDAYVELGGLLVKVGDFEGALQCYRDAVRLDPSDPANHHNLKAVLGRLAEKDPNRYGTELEAANIACETAAQGKPKKLTAHRW